MAKFIIDYIDYCFVKILTDCIFQNISNAAAKEQNTHLLLLKFISRYQMNHEDITKHLQSCHQQTRSLRFICYIFKNFSTKMIHFSFLIYFGLFGSESLNVLLLYCFFYATTQFFIQTNLEKIEHWFCMPDSIVNITSINKKLPISKFKKVILIDSVILVVVVSSSAAAAVLRVSAKRTSQTGC